jgi:predicted nucleic acid-binding protein
VTAYYLDSNALVKRYIAETGSTWVGQLTDPAASHDLYAVALAGPELVAAIVRRQRGGHLSSAHATRALAAVRVDWPNLYIRMDIDQPTIGRAMNLAETHGLRGSDAVHLAAALEIHQQRRTLALPALTFVSADQEQLRAAAAEGLAVDDPNLHP